MATIEEKKAVILQRFAKAKESTLAKVVTLSLELYNFQLESEKDIKDLEAEKKVDEPAKETAIEGV